ncbi:MAG: DNA repair protein RecO [Clostridia bacterium]
MENIKDKGIVISSFPYKDSDKIVTIFCLEQGKISVRFTGVRKPNAKLLSVTQPCCFAEFVFAEGKAGKVAISAECFDSFFDISKDYSAYVFACSALEIVSRFSRDGGESDSRLFVSLLKLLKSLAYDLSFNSSFAFIKFLLELLDEQGYGISFVTDSNYDAVCFNSSEGAVIFTKQGLVFGESLTIKEAELMYKLQKTDEKVFNVSVEETRHVVVLLSKYLTDKTGEQIVALTKLLNS